MTRMFTFECPRCGDLAAETVETHARAGMELRCASCETRVVFVALTAHEAAMTEKLRWGCALCAPSPCRRAPLEEGGADETSDEEKGGPP